MFKKFIKFKIYFFIILYLKLVLIVNFNIKEVTKFTDNKFYMNVNIK